MTHPIINKEKLCIESGRCTLRSCPWRASFQRLHVHVSELVLVVQIPTKRPRQPLPCDMVQCVAERTCTSETDQNVFHFLTCDFHHFGGHGEDGGQATSVRTRTNVGKRGIPAGLSSWYLRRKNKQSQRSGSSMMYHCVVRRSMCCGSAKAGGEGGTRIQTQSL